MVLPVRYRSAGSDSAASHADNAWFAKKMHELQKASSASAIFDQVCRTSPLTCSLFHGAKINFLSDSNSPIYRFLMIQWKKY
jgi:hypothetical protein